MIHPTELSSQSTVFRKRGMSACRHARNNAELEYANNLRSTIGNVKPGQNSTIIQFNLQQAQKKLKEDYFKQKCQSLLKKKIDFLVNHRRKVAAQNKRVIRCNLNQQNNNLLRKLLGDDIPLSTPIKRKKKSKHVVDRPVSQISCEARRVSYCDVAPTSKLEFKEKTSTFGERRETVQLPTGDVVMSKTHSAFKTMESSSTDAQSKSICFITSSNPFVTPIK